MFNTKQIISKYNNNNNKENTNPLTEPLLINTMNNNDYNNNDNHSSRNDNNRVVGNVRDDAVSLKNVTTEDDTINNNNNNNNNNTYFHRDKDKSVDAIISPTINSKTDDYTVGRVYASNAPKIFLETITARSATLVIVITYVFFIVGFIIDFFTTYSSFNSYNYELDGLCSYSNSIQNVMTTSSSSSSLSSSHTYGCSDFKSWNGTINHLTNVISIGLHVNNKNISELYNYNISNSVTRKNGIEIKYNVILWACYNLDGCDTNFQNNYEYTNNPNIYQKVLKNFDQSYQLFFGNDIIKNNEYSYHVSMEIFPTTFQNQESIPTNGLVKSYFIHIEYLKDDYHIFSNDKNNRKNNNVIYKFDISNRNRQAAQDSITIVLLIITVIVLSIYIYILSKQRKILSEQIWVICYFFLIILLQNPVYCIIAFYKSPPTIEAAYTSYLITYISQSGLFILWLLFADSILRKTSSKLYFYLPKLLFGFTILTFGILILTFQFPGVIVNFDNKSRNAVEAVSDWSDYTKKEFVSFTFIYLLSIWIWTIWWFIRLYYTGVKLKKLPYMSTRYIQLSYRFFTLQATLVTLYYIFQYIIVIFFISQGVNSDNYNITSITDNINILFRQQSQLFGKILFLTTYALVLSFLFLPANLMDNSHGIMGSLAATFVITENEHNLIVKQRKMMIKNMKRNLLNQVTLMNQIVNAKADVFCVDIALKLRNISFQAYYDPIHIHTISGYDGVMNLSKIGFESIDFFYNNEYEVFCFISKEILTGKIVVAFRYVSE